MHRIDTNILDAAERVFAESKINDVAPLVEQDKIVGYIIYSARRFACRLHRRSTLRCRRLSSRTTPMKRVFKWCSFTFT
jgi:hypothetical protein